MTSGGLELGARDVSVQFEGLKALSKVTLTVPRGRITGLIGPNGAGKTTLINVLTGFQPVGTGTVELEGEVLNGIAAHKLRRKGVARTFQSGRLFRDLPVVDNHLLLDEPAAGMSEHESHDLAVIIRRIAGELGVGVLLIEHNIGLVLELCERIFVLDSGEIIEVGIPAQIRDSDAVRHAYMGTQRDEVIPALATEMGAAS